MATPCPFCEKKGLPILPIRYGIAPTKTFGHYKVTRKPPDATALLGPAEVPLDVSETIYTGRTLRAGYLYLFYEAHNHWEAYAVDSAGCLSMVPLVDDTPPGGDRFHEDCKRNATKLANASVVTIQDPGSAGKVWFGFSDAWWTKAVRNTNARLSAKERAKFMRVVDIAAWYSGGKPGAPMPGHAFQIYQVDMIVAEYAMELVDEVSAFRWSPFLCRDIVSATTLKSVCDALMPAKGLVLVLQDPAGIAQEIPAYMNARWEGFSDQWQRPTDLDTNLTNLQAAVERQAEMNLYNDRVRQSQDEYRQLLNSGGTAFMLESYRKEMQPLLDNAKKVKFTADDLEHARKAAWEPYRKLINPEKRGAYRTQYAKASDEYDKRIMRPLAEAHVAWMRSAGMNAAFDYHFDANDINTGVGFTALFAACVMGTGGYVPCVKLYDEWLRGGMSAHNLMWRTLFFNHPELQSQTAQVCGVVSKSDDKKTDATNGLPNPGKWSKVFSLYKTVVSKLKMAGENAYKTIDVKNALPEVLVELGPRMVAVIKERGPAGQDLAAALGMHAGMPVQRLQVVGTRRDVYSAMYNALETLQPAAMGPDKADRAMIAQARMAILEAEAKKAGYSLDEQVRSWSLLLDASEADPDALYRLSSDAQGKLAANRILSFGKAQGAEVVTSVPVNSYMGKVLRFARSPGMLASVSMVFATLGWSNAQDAESKALKSEEGRVAWAFRAATTGLVGGMLDLVSTGIKSTGVRKLPLLGPVAKRLGGGFLRFVKLGGAGAGVVAMWVAVGIDAVNIYEAVHDREYGVFALYAARGVAEGFVGVLLTRALFIAIVSGAEVEALGPPAWIATAIILALSVLIDIFRDPPTLTWARNCLWGPEDSYEDGSEEQANFIKATAG
ncbi:T6SS effector BTH_I2691 family protein [Burkholderia pseudomultivorans]|nr:T6SS effector BTH_I2691 family protein [Burkholderia pseudomultivorans]